MSLFNSISIHRTYYMEKFHCFIVPQEQKYLKLELYFSHGIFTLWVFYIWTNCCYTTLSNQGATYPTSLTKQQKYMKSICQLFCTKDNIQH